MKKVILYAVILMMFFISEIQAQSFIGLDKNSVRSLVRKSGYAQDNMTTSQVFNYLKFVNSAGTKTLIVFFSDDDISTHTRLVCDYSEYDFVIADNNKAYKKKGRNKWEYSEGKNNFEVTLEEKEWYFVLIVKKK